MNIRRCKNTISENTTNPKLSRPRRENPIRFINISRLNLRSDFMGKKAKPVDLLMIVGGLSAGYNYVGGGGQGLDAIRDKDPKLWMSEVREKFQPSRFITDFIPVNAPWIVGAIGQKILKRKNPGMTIGGYRIKLF